MTRLPLPDVHITAFDGTDQAECQDGGSEPCTSDVRLVTCTACRVRIDGVYGPGRFPLNPGD